MSDLERRLRDLFEEIAPPPDLGRLLASGKIARSGMRWAGAVAALVAIVIGFAVAVAISRTPEPASTTTTTSIPPTTTSTVATTTTSLPEETTTTLALPTEPGRGGTITVALDWDLFSTTYGPGDEAHPPTLNPLLADVGGHDFGHLVVPGAYRVDAVTGELTPWTVEDIPSLANGGLVMNGDGTVAITYRVRDEAVWEDGTPITGEDLATTYRVYAAQGMLDDSPYELIDPDSITTDGKTFTARLVHPDPRYETLFEWIVPHNVDPASFADDWNDHLWLSGGPFRLVSYQPTTQPSENEPSVIVLERNPNYWEVDPATGLALPYLDGIDLLAYTQGPADPSQTVAYGLRNRTIDLAMGSLFHPKVNAWTLGDAPEFTVAVEWDTLFEVMGFQMTDARFEVNPDSLNQYLLYRQAVLSAIDRGAVGAATDELPMVSILDTAIPGLSDDPWSRYDDPGQAAALLADLGAEIGRDFGADPPHAVYVISSGEETIDIGNAVVDQLETAGWDAEVSYEGDYFGTVLPQGLMDLTAIRTFALPAMSGLLDTLAFFDPLRQDPFLDWSSVGEAARRYHQVIAAADGELDRGRLSDLLREAEQILADQAVIYPLVRRQPHLRAYWPDRVQGFDPNPQQDWETWNAASWWSPAQATEFGP
jgi:ABC-type transport system substrate-binding protein